MFTGVVSWGNLSYTEVGWPHISIWMQLVWKFASGSRGYLTIFQSQYFSHQKFKRLKTWVDFFSINTDCWTVRGHLSVHLSTWITDLGTPLLNFFVMLFVNISITIFTATKNSNAWKLFGPLSFLKFLVSPIYMQCCEPTLMCIIKWSRVNSQLHSFLNRHTLPALILQAWGVKLPMLMIYNSWW